MSISVGAEFFNCASCRMKRSLGWHKSSCSEPSCSSSAAYGSLVCISIFMKSGPALEILQSLTLSRKRTQQTPRCPVVSRHPIGSAKQRVL